MSKDRNLNSSSKIQRTNAKNSFLQDLLSGALAGGISVSLIQPLEVVKTRAEARNETSQQYKKILSAFSLILRQEGIKGMWKGLKPAVLTAIPSSAIYFSVLKQISNFQKQKKENLSAFDSLIAGSIARTIATICTAPAILLKTRFESLEVIKIYNQASPSVIHSFQITLQKEGLQGLFRGLIPTLVRDVPWASLQFTFYSQLKKTKFLQESKNSFDEILNKGNSTSSFFTQRMKDFIAGSLGGAAATIITQPADVLKTRLQLQSSGIIQYKGILDATIQIISQEGFLSFWKGFRARLVHRMLLPGLAWTFYEFLASIKFSYFFGNK